jgi:cytochrome c peroxidase
MRFKIIVSAAALGSVVTGCGTTDDFTDEEWAKIKAIEPLAGGPPRSPFNHLDEDDTIAKLGQMLFFEKDVAEAITVAGPSGNVGEIRKVACVNCHDSAYFADTHQSSISPPGASGTNGLIPGLSHGRNWLGTNTGQMVNLHWYDWTLWTGRFDSMVEHGVNVWGTSATLLAQARFMYAKYKDEYNAAFPLTPLDDRLGLPTTDPANVYPATGAPSTGAPGPFEMMPADAQAFMHQFRANLGRLFDNYPRRLTTPDSPFQRYVRDRDFSALSGAAKRGLRLFIGKAACNDCHVGPIMSDNKFHNIGAPNVTALPGASMTAPLLAPNRGRASVVPVLVASVNTLDANPDALVFNGAGKFSDNRELGMQRLVAVRQQDAEHCICRRTDAVADAAACTDAVISSPTQIALRGVTSLECLKEDPVDGCVCRKPEAITTIDACTASVVTSAAQLALRAETKISCLKYDDQLEGMFRTPSLLNIADTAPYFHSGLAKSLEDVVWFYNEGGGPVGTFAGKKSPEIRPLGLTDNEVNDLVAFLQSLSGLTPAQVAAKKKQEAVDRGEDPSTVWDWSKNTAKPPLTGLGGAGGAMGTGGAGGRGGGGGSATGGSAAGGSAAAGTGGGGGGGAGGGTGGAS